MIKTSLCLTALLIPLAGCMGNATVSTRDADRGTTVRRAEESASIDGWRIFGEPVSTEAPAVDVADVLAQPAAFAGRDVQVRGTISEVCQERGCWVRIADAAGSAETVFVKFTCPVDGRLIPQDAAGKPIQVQGQVVVEEMSQDQARHYATDAGKPQAQIEAIVGPQKVVRVMSPSARLRV